MKRLSSSEIFGDRARRVVLILIGLSATGTLAAIVFGDRLAPLHSTERDTFGLGPIGHRLLAESLSEVGYFVRISTGDRFEGPSAPLLFLEPAPEARVEGRAHTLGRALRRREEAGRTSIVVLPKWTLVPNPVGPRAEVSGIDANEVLAEIFDEEIPEEDAATQLMNQLSGLPDTRGDKIEGASGTVRMAEESESSILAEGTLGSFELVVPRIQTFDSIPPGMEPLLETSAGAIILEDSRRNLVIVSDPDVAHTFALLHGDHLALWLALLRHVDDGGDTVVIDEVFHGHGRVHSLRRALGQFPAVLIVIHALFVILLVLRFGAVRFGPPARLPPRAYGPGEAIGTAASVLADGQQLGVLAQRYVVEILDDLARQLGVEHSQAPQRALEIDKVAERRGVAPEAVRLLGAAARMPGDKKEARRVAWTLARASQTFRARLLGVRRSHVDPPAEGRGDDNLGEHERSPREEKSAA